MARFTREEARQKGPTGKYRAALKGRRVSQRFENEIARLLGVAAEAKTEAKRAESKVIAAEVEAAQASAIAAMAATSTVLTTTEPYRSTGYDMWNDYDYFGQYVE